MSLPIQAGGNALVQRMLREFLAEAEKNPNIAYGEVILIEHDKNPFGGMAGDTQLEPKAERAARAQADQIRERIINRVMPPRPAGVPADYACYNMPGGSVCFDFLIWLIDAEMSRIREGAAAPLKVHFWFGRDGKTGIYTPEQQQMFDHVMKPALALIGAVEDLDAKYGHDYPMRHMREITRAAQMGEKVPMFRATVKARQEWKAERYAPGYVTITLREADHWPHRNSDLSAWTKFALDLEDQGERVYFIRDTAKAGVPLEGFTTLPRAAVDLDYRAAVYEQAKANLFVANGPSALCQFGDRPWLCFTPIEPDDSAYKANTPAFWRMNIGIDVGGQFPWSAPDQRFIWQRDTYENICAAWKTLTFERKAA